MGLPDEAEIELLTSAPIESLSAQERFSLSLAPVAAQEESLALAATVAGWASALEQLVVSLELLIRASRETLASATLPIILQGTLTLVNAVNALSVGCCTFSGFP